MKRNYGLFFLFLVLIFAPLFYAFREFKGLAFDAGLLREIYLYSGGQALASVALTLTLALPGAMGLFWVRDKAPAGLAAAFEFAILLPSLLPKLFVLVSFLNLIPAFPFGLPGVVILHAFSEVGLVALIFHRLLQHKLASYIDAAELMGCGRHYFLKTVMPLVAPQMIQVAYVLFLYFLASVSIPLILAGGQFTSLEAAIYQKILMAHDWNQALNLFAVQVAFIAVLISLLGLLPETPTDAQPHWPSGFLALPSGVVPVLAPLAVILVSLLIKIPLGLIELSREPQVLDGWTRYLSGSLLVGFAAGGFSFVGMTVLAYFYQEPRLRRWFALVMNPSSIMMGFAFFLMPGTLPVWIYVKMATALGLTFLPALKRLGLLARLESLGPQAEAALLLGASPLKVFLRGLWPQALPQIALLSGLGGVWAMGDFGVSRVIAGQDMTLAMWTQSLVDQYRWDMALVLSWLILAASFVVFGFFWSLSYVSHKKLGEEV